MFHAIAWGVFDYFFRWGTISLFGYGGWFTGKVFAENNKMPVWWKTSWCYIKCLGVTAIIAAFCNYDADEHKLGTLTHYLTLFFTFSIPACIGMALGMERGSKKVK